MQLFVLALSFLLTSGVAVSGADTLPAVSSGDSVVEENVTISDQGSDVNILSGILEDIDNKLNTVVLSLETSVDAYQVSEYYREYFKGILQNMGYTEYLCYAQRLPNSNGYNYITHYYLMYDLHIEDGQIVPGTYPCIDVYSIDNVYYMDQITKTFDGYPTMGYASFAPYSTLIDNSFPTTELICVVIGVMLMFILLRKSVFS